jgi:hypothetical protein
MRVVATATSVTQGIVWTFDRVNRKLRGFTMGSASLATIVGGRYDLKELTSRLGNTTASGFKAKVFHIEAIGW